MDATVVLSASVYVIVSMRPTAFRSPSAVRSRSTVAAGAPIVIEATGKHHKSPQALHAYFERGVSKVLVAAPTGDALNIVYGVNHHRYDPARHHVTAGRVQLLVPLQIGADFGDHTVFDKNVGLVGEVSRDDGPVLDDFTHGF